MADLADAGVVLIDHAASMRSQHGSLPGALVVCPGKRFCQFTGVLRGWREDGEAIGDFGGRAG